MPADGIVELFNPPRPGRVLVNLNIRSGITVGAPRIGRAVPDETLEIEASLRGESVQGQGIWYRLRGDGRFVWGGGVALGSTQAPPPVVPPVATRGPLVQTRANGTILPLTVPQIGRVFGTFMSRPATKPGFIDIDRAWVEENIVDLPVPALERLGFRRIPVHRLASRHFDAVFTQIEQERLDDDLLSCGGTFVPRHISLDVNRPLSSHSWGIAIDLNVAWNGYKQRPALITEHGTVRRLLPIFAAHGFAWGGDFSTGADGMHFELARTDV